MSARLPFRLSTLLFAALAWAVVPTLLFAAPGAGGGHGGGGGSHGGGGGSHGGGGGGAGHGGGGGHASGSAGHAGSSPASGNYHSAGNGPSGGYRGQVQANSYASSGAGSAQGGASFASFSAPGGPRSAATEAMLSHMAASGWSFTPSAGVARPVATRSAPMARIPAVLPPAGSARLPRRPNPTGTIIPRQGPCSRRFGFSSCGFGFGYGFGYGFGGFGYGYGLGYGMNALYSLPADNYYPPDDGAYMDIEGGYIAEPGGTVPPDVDAAPANPDELGPAATPQVPAQIILKDGSAYAVKSYWVSNGELYYQPVTGGLNHVSVDQLDLAATVAANSRNGVPFTLSDRPPHD